MFESCQLKYSAGICISTLFCPDTHTHTHKYITKIEKCPLGLHQIDTLEDLKVRCCKRGRTTTQNHGRLAE